MRISFNPPLSLDELRVTPLHVIVRDFPETLQEFRVCGVSLEQLGDRAFGELDDPGRLRDALEASTAWRQREASS